FSVRQLPLAHQLSYKQNFWIPVSSTDHLLCNLPSKMNVRTAMGTAVIKEPVPATLMTELLR
ncbi:MAG: hypothetical protein ACR5LA_10885, partial [Wolbachia sp.]